MTWSEVRGHDRLIELFRTSQQRGRLGSALLFVGPPGVGKRTFALKFAQALLCEAEGRDPFEPCGRCPACQQVVSLTHPDLAMVCKPKEKSFIPIELFIGDREHRMREGLCRHVAMKPFRGGRKIAIIDDADYLNNEGANCLLKTLEEPPQGSIIILIASNLQRQLPTVRSRCQTIRFQPLPKETIADLLFEQEFVEDREHASRLAALSDGGMEKAAQLNDPEIWEFREKLLEMFSSKRFSGVDYARSINEFVEEAGKDAPSRRERLRLVIGFAVDFYRALLRLLSGAEVEGDQPLQTAATSAARHWPGDEEGAAACLLRSSEAETQVRSNANLSAVVQCWIADLAEMHHTGRPLVGESGLWSVS